MKKKDNAVKATAEIAKNTLVKPSSLYSKDEVRQILHLGKGSCLSPSKFAGLGGRGKVKGEAIIAHLESRTNGGRGRRSFVKIGRRYPSGTVTVVAR